MPARCKLTKELQAEVCKHLEEGLFRRAAAALVEIDEVTFSRWYHRGATEERGRFHEFFVAVNKAEATFAQTCTAQLKSGAVANPKNAQWLLSRRFPAEYGRRDNVEEHRPEDKAANQAALRDLLIERLEKLVPEPEAAPQLSEGAAAAVASTTTPEPALVAVTAEPEAADA